MKKKSRVKAYYYCCCDRYIYLHIVGSLTKEIEPEREMSVLPENKYSIFTMGLYT